MTMDKITATESCVVGKPEQKYEVGQTVVVQSWTGSTIATILDIDWGYHPRCYSYCWCYKVDKEVGLTFIYIPEGYLRPYSECPE